MSSKKIIVLAASVGLLWASLAHAQSEPRSAYSYVRETSGGVTVVSEANGSVEARRNLPISSGDTLSTEDPARAEVSMADGNVLQVGGGTEIKFASLSGQQGSEDAVSAIDLTSGSVILSAVGNDDRAVPRVDTDDATVYASLGSRVRVNTDSRRGTAVIVRAGSVEVRTRSGSYTVRAGNYLTVHGDEEAEIARGEFSHDRFDGWAADRLEAVSESTRSASSRYVGEDYAGDVQSLDGYGDWDYNSTYDATVWRPRVAAGWSPYSNGSWYYTPVGLSWWSWDPWGWFPFHYGNWFFDTGWNNWCWSPGLVYSPAWVYWGFSGNYFGWCPVGWYGGFSPWWNTFRQWSFPRNGVSFAINGRFSTRQVALRGWNFTNAANVGARGRVDVIAGTRIVNRLGSDFSISSRPLVVQTRAGGNVRDALREQIRETPRTIQRTAGSASERLAPVVAREAKLPAASADALRERAVIAERGRLTGPGAPEVAPRGATIVDRGESGRTEVLRRDSSGRTVITNRGGNGVSSDRGRPAVAPDRGARPEMSRPSPRAEATDSWRGRSEAPRSADTERGRITRSPETRSPETRSPATRAPETRAPLNRELGPSNRERADAWRQGARPPSASPREEPVQRGGQSWRSRSDVPTARRVIEGAVPGRRAPESGRGSDSWRGSPRSREAAPREAPRNREQAPNQRDFSNRDRAPAPREAPRNRELAPYQRDFSYRDRAPAPRERDYAPRYRSEPPPNYRAAPPPSSRGFAPQAPPRSIDRGPSRESAPPRAAPPSRSEPHFSSPRSAPPPNRGRPGP